MKINKCPLCSSVTTTFLCKDKKREYFNCKNCKTINVPKEFQLSKIEEKKRYDNHENSLNDENYIKFLKRIIYPIQQYVTKGSKGLDFGCGPSPILKTIFKSLEIEIQEYDLYYNNDISVISKKWDFIVATEVFEHLKKPMETIEMLWQQILPGGILAIMTNLYTPNIIFNSWYYKGDPTHICFYSKESFYWLKEKLKAEVEFFDKDIIILKKN